MPDWRCRRERGADTLVRVRVSSPGLAPVLFTSLLHSGLVIVVVVVTVVVSVVVVKIVTVRVAASLGEDGDGRRLLGQEVPEAHALPALQARPQGAAAVRPGQQP